MSRDALVVGINTYQYLPSLKAPAQDAEAIAQQLHQYGEFRVHRLPEVIQEGKPQVGRKTSVTLRELETALINLFKPKGSNVPQTAVFYFSGHGIQRDAGIQEGYLALSDSNPEQGFYGLSLFWLRRLLQESPVRQRIIWLDCCHSGELLNFLEADPGAHPGTDRLFMAASREYETAYESLEGEYSIFTNALLTGLDPSRIPSGVITNHALTDWVNHTLKGEIQQPLFESSGSEIILTRRGTQQSEAPTSPTRIQSTDICPYRGLEFFDELHADYFFGREALTAQLLDKLDRNQFIAITGASGSGKSSLVRAGLMAQLRQGRKILGSEQWKVRLLTPTEHPLKSLASAFIDPELVDLERAEQLRRAETFLQDGGAGLAQLVRASLPCDSTTGLTVGQRPQFLLIIDQFEEVFTLSQGSQAERERQEFFDCLIGALDLAKDWLKIVVVLRADFSSKCALYEGLAQQISQHQITVTPLKYEQIKATIVRPAQKVGLVCEPNLIYTMMMDVIGAPGELPLLQYTLLELWHRRRVGSEGGIARLTLDAYQSLGGVRGTLQKRATEVYQSLNPEEQGVAKRVFLALTQLGEGTEDTRRRVVKSELIGPGFPTELVDQVLEKLVAAKLVVISQENLTKDAGFTSSNLDSTLEATAVDSLSSLKTMTAQLTSASKLTNSKFGVSGRALSQEIVDVTHEALIRNWPLLRTWVDQSREVVRRQRRIEQAASEWDQAGQPTTGDYLLSGLRLRDAEDFLKLYPNELSALGQQFVSVSCTECLRARRQCRRSQIAMPTALAATFLLVLSQSYSVVRSQSEKDNQAQKATAYERTALAQAVLQDSNSDPITALLLSRLAVQGGETGYATQASLRAALQNLRLQAQLDGHQGAVEQILFSPDQRYLTTAGSDGTVRLWDMGSQTIHNATLQASKVLQWAEGGQAPAAIHAITFSPDSQFLAAIADNSPVANIWSVETGKVVRQVIGRAPLKQISFSPAGWMITLDTAGSVSVWQSATGELKGHLPHRALAMQISPDGNTVLTAGEDGTAQLWQIVFQPNGKLNFKQLKTFSHPDVVYQAQFSPHGRWIATLCKDGKVRLWNLQGQLLRLFATDNAASTAGQPATTGQTQSPNLAFQVKQMAFSPDAKTLATIDTAGQTGLWNIQTGQFQTQLQHNSKSFEVGLKQQTSETTKQLIAFSPNGELLVTATSSGEHGRIAYLWDRQTGKEIGKLAGQGAEIRSLQFSPDGTYVVTASAEGTIRLWTSELGGELPSLQVSSGAVESLAFLPGSAQFQNALAAASPQLGTGSEALDKGVQAGQQPQLAQATGQVRANSTTSIVAVSPEGKLQQWQILTDPLPKRLQGNLKAQPYMAAIQSEAISHFRDQLGGVFAKLFNRPITSRTSHHNPLAGSVCSPAICSPTCC
jgi:WD40 repeat protein/energy-coupling factor transporter ATP-binding protein EcfA2